jgi:hypothetical protein
MAEALKTAWDATGKQAIVATLFAPSGSMASDWVPSADDRDTITTLLN